MELEYELLRVRTENEHLDKTMEDFGGKPFKIVATILRPDGKKIPKATILMGADTVAECNKLVEVIVHSTGAMYGASDPEHQLQVAVLNKDFDRLVNMSWTRKLKDLRPKPKL